MPKRKLIAKTEGELKKRIPFFTRWEIARDKNLKGKQVDLLISAKSNNQIYRFCVEIKAAGYPHYVRNGAVVLKEFTKTNPSYYPIVVVPFISERGKKICNEYHIGYIDFSGNAKIAHKNIFVYTEGRHRAEEAMFVSQSIFSPKAARITKLLLNYPRAKWIQKEIAEKTALSKGLVSRIINEMIKAGYIVERDQELVLTNFDDLFSAWAESEIRRREKKRNYYMWAQNPQKMMHAVAAGLSRDKIKYAFTQEAGASLLAPFSTFDIVSVYVESLDNFPEKALSISRVDKGFNLIAIEAPDDNIFMGAKDKNGLKIVDDLQMYADLMKNPLRGEKQAGHILALIKKRLK